MGESRFTQFFSSKATSLIVQGLILCLIAVASQFGLWRVFWKSSIRFRQLTEYEARPFRRDDFPHQGTCLAQAADVVASVHINQRAFNATGSWLILAAMMKSLPERPPIACVQSSMATLRYPTRYRSGWWPSSSAS